MTNAQLNALAALAVRTHTRFANGAMPLPNGYLHRLVTGNTMRGLVDGGLVWSDGYDYALTEAGKAECRTRNIPLSAGVAGAATPPQKANA